MCHELFQPRLGQFLDDNGNILYWRSLIMYNNNHKSEMMLGETAFSVFYIMRMMPVKFHKIFKPNVTICIYTQC